MYNYYNKLFQHKHARAHTHARARTHTFIPWIHKCVTKTKVCGTYDKYTNIHNFYSVKYCKKFIKQYYRSSLHKIFIYRVGGVCIQVLPYCYFKFCLFILKNCQCTWSVVKILIPTENALKKKNLNKQ